MAEEPRRLGRGLAALIGSAPSDNDVGAQNRAQNRRAPVEFLRPNPRNPRKEFGDADLDDLSNSIREKGILQPIVVRPVSGSADLYEIIAGERRWRAAQKAGLHEVPIISIAATDQEALELAIVENVQRTDLNALEEAHGYERLVVDYGYTHAEIAKTIGKSRSHVANMTRLVKLPEKTKKLLSEGRISAGHARALLAVQEPDAVAMNIVDKGLTVRDVEKIAQVEANRPEPSTPGARPQVAAHDDPNVRALEKKLGDALGMHVTVKAKGEAGELVIRYRSLEQLDSLCDRLTA
jgi:ParB family transcriptional regulator, chromosome partitioning protein